MSLVRSCLSGPGEVMGSRTALGQTKERRRRRSTWLTDEFAYASAGVLHVCHSVCVCVCVLHVCVA